MGWAIFVLGIVFVATTLLFAIVGSVDGSPPPRFDSYLFSVFIALALLAGPLAFHRRRWWAWDLSIAVVLLAWVLAPLALAAQIAPADPAASTGAGRIFILLIEVLFFGIPLPAATLVLLHNDVRQAFPHPLPLAPRLAAAYLAVATPLHLLEAIAADPRLFFGAALPRWGTVLWSAAAATAYFCAAVGLYRGRRFARPVALVIAAAILAQAAAGLFRPSLSSLPRNFHYFALGNGVNLLFGLAIAAAVLLPRRSLPEFSGPPIPAVLPEIRR